MKPSIVYVITRAEIGGGQSHVLDLLHGLHRKCRLHLVTGETGPLTEAAGALGVEVHVVPTLVQPMDPPKDLRAVFALVGLLKRIKPDLVHAHTSKAGFHARLAAWLCGVPSVFTAHTWCFAEGTARMWKLVGTPLEKAAARVCHKIIAVSEANRQLALDQGLPANKIVTIHNGIPDSPERARPGGDSGVVKILMVARFVRQKDHATLLRALPELNGRAEVLFAGGGPLRQEMEELARELGVAQHVRFLGDRHDIPDLLASSHIFALPTNWEGFPISILEGMRAGLPIIASDVGGVSEAVKDGVTGFTVPAGRPREFAQKLSILAGSAQLRQDFGRAARLSYERNFTRQLMLDRTILVYSEVVPQLTAQVPVVYQETHS